MISHKHKFIFVHVPKTAGNSIQNYLVEYSEDNIEANEKQAQYNIDSKSYLDRFAIRSSDEKFKIKKHTTLNQYYAKWREEYGDIEDYFKLGATRNPWDRAISFYFWKGPKSFNKRRFMNNLPRRSCADYFYVEKYKSHKLDYVIRFENLQEDFNAACNKIGIPRQQLPWANKSKHKHYTEYYDDETRQIVAEKYAKDIEYFGYEFGK